VTGNAAGSSSPPPQEAKSAVDEKEQMLRREQEKRREYAAKQEQLQSMFSNLNQLTISNTLVEANGDVDKAIDTLLNLQAIETARSQARNLRAQQQQQEQQQNKDIYTPPGQVFRESSRPGSAVAFTDNTPVETQLLEAARESNIDKIRHFFAVKNMQFAGKEFSALYQKCLMATITAGDLDATELFLQAGASPDGPSDTTQTSSPLGLALQCNHPEIAKMMIQKYKANPNKMNGPRSPLHVAVMSSLNGIVALLIERGANVNAEELDSGRTALHMAISIGNLDIVQLLLTHGINVSKRDFMGETAVHFAFRTAKSARDQILLNLIMEHIKDDQPMINSQNSRSGDTILHIAVARCTKSTQSVELVLKCHPNPNVQNSVGKTALEMALESSNEAVVALIVSYADSWVAPPPGKEPTMSPPNTSSPATQRKAHQYMPIADLGGKSDSENDGGEASQQLPGTVMLSTPDPDWLIVSQFKDRLERNMGQFETEYEELEAGSTDQILNGDFSSSLTKINLPKNRYRNILPLERTRVRLLNLEGIESSDYVNANYVGADLRGERAYIVTQGPLDSTTPDFWRMVWEQNVSIIVMLSTFVEDGKSKVFPYFPQDHNDMDAGFFVVSLQNIQDETQLILRQFSIKLRHTGETRFVSHLQYVAWPDQGLPKDTKGFRTIIDEADRLNNSNGPTVVHCSAGIGRSGVFCVVHSIITKLKALLCASFDTTFNIQETLIRMRMDRIALVQNKEQYVFCCLALRDTLEEYLRVLAYKNESWFHRTSNPAQAAQTLAKSAFGTFMFVPSTEPGCLALVFISRGESNQLIPKKQEIFVSDGGFEINSEVFPTLTSLVHSQPSALLRPYAARNKYKVKTANPPTINH